MRVLDLFAGLKGGSAAFAARGHQVVTLNIDPRFGCTITGDIMAPDVIAQVYANGPYDFVWASPPCEAFSVASIGHHWTGGTRAYVPKTLHAEHSQEMVAQTIRLIAGLGPRFWIMENPRGVLRKLPCVAGLPRVTVTYCQYGEPRMKPTDLWGCFPPALEFLPMCKNGDPCHEAAPRGAKTGTQGIAGAAERAVVPYLLSLAVCEALEKQNAPATRAYFEEEAE